ncbi:MAG: hypothetical protein WCE90_02620 [Candidatus Zixiibacteriota bacterium]
MGKKIIFFWKGYEISNNQDIYLYKEFSSILDVLLAKPLIYLPFGLIGPLSILGLAIGLTEWRRHLLLYLFVLSYSASVIIFFICSACRMPVIPFLIMFGSYSLWWVFQRIKEKRVIAVSGFLAVLILLLLVTNTRLESLVGDQRPADHFTLGTVYQQLGKGDLAVKEWKASLESNPGFNPARINLAMLYSEMGKTARESAPSSYLTIRTPPFSGPR